MRLHFIKYGIIPFFIVGLLLSSMAQDYRAFDIPDSLKKDAHAVILFDSANVEIHDIHGYSYSEEKIITVLDPTLENLALIAVPYNDRESVKSFKAWLYDADGNIIKISRDLEIADVSANGINLAGSGRLKMLNMKKLKAPFTIKYVFQKQITGTAFMPLWQPVNMDGESIRRAKFQVNYPQNIPVKFISNKLNKPEKTDGKYSWEINGFTATPKEEYATAPARMLPWVNIMPQTFELYDIKGSAESWNDIGKFMNAIDPMKNDLKHINDHELNKIFDSKESDLEKVKALFEYLEHNFHYAGIELGIGGWRPEEVSVTLQKKYGDCKALAALLRALLKRAGITSYYTLINAGDELPAVQSDFPDLNFNHVILCVPLQNDTIWLECTSPLAPFNYLYKSTTDRQALIIFDGGGQLVRTPAHNENYNISSSVSHIIKSTEDNACSISTVINRKGDLQDTLSYVITQNNAKLSEAVIYYILHLKNTTINSFTVKQLDPDSPRVTLTLALTNANAIRKTDSRIFLKTDLPTPISSIPSKNEKRTQPINVDLGYTQSDTIIYSLPVGCTPENFKAKDTRELTDKFGYANCNMNYSPETGELTVIRNFCLKHGTYSKDQYPAFRDFLLKALQTSCPELVLRKKE